MRGSTAKSHFSQLCQNFETNPFAEEELRCLFFDSSVINSRFEGEATQLMLAAQRGHYELATILLQEKADVSLKDSKGRTALHYAAESDSESMAKLLLAYRADPLASSDTGETPLFEALRRRNWAVAFALVHKLVDPPQGVLPPEVPECEDQKLAIARIAGRLAGLGWTDAPLRRLLGVLPSEKGVAPPSVGNADPPEKVKKSKPKKSKSKAKKIESAVPPPKQEPSPSIIVIPRKKEQSSLQRQAETQKQDAKLSILLAQKEQIMREIEQSELRCRELSDENSQLRAELEKMTNCSNSIRTHDSEQDEQNSKLFELNASVDQSSMESLCSLEIEEFVKKTFKANEELAPHIYELIDRVRQVLEGLRPKGQVCIEIYGSFQTGLRLGWSDVDLLVNSKFDSSSDTILEELNNQLANASFIVKRFFIPTASFPVLKLTSSDEFKAVKLDVTVSDPRHLGLQCAALVSTYLMAFPPLASLVLVVKQLLYNAGMNDSYEGGLSSYGVILMIVAFLQYLEFKVQFGSQHFSLGRLLKDLLKFYGGEFDYRNCMILPGLPDDRKIPFVYKQANHFPGFGQEGLTILDPLNPGNNVAKSTLKESKYLQLERLFAAAYFAVSEPCFCDLEHLKTCEPGSGYEVTIENESILQRVFHAYQNNVFSPFKFNGSQQRMNQPNF